MTHSLTEWLYSSCDVYGIDGREYTKSVEFYGKVLLGVKNSVKIERKKSQHGEFFND